MTYILGGWQSEFARNWGREGQDIAGAFRDALGSGLTETGLEPRDIETGHVGNFVAELFARQGLLGGLFGLVHPDLDGLPKRLGRRLPQAPQAEGAAC
jgi:acetyl-CoA C-acetyltransferase